MLCADPYSSKCVSLPSYVALISINKHVSQRAEPAPSTRPLQGRRKRRTPQCPHDSHEGKTSTYRSQRRTRPLHNRFPGWHRHTYSLWKTPRLQGAVPWRQTTGTCVTTPRKLITYFICQSTAPSLGEHVRNVEPSATVERSWTKASSNGTFQRLDVHISHLLRDAEGRAGNAYNACIATCPASHVPIALRCDKDTLRTEREGKGAPPLPPPRPPKLWALAPSSSGGCMGPACPMGALPRTGPVHLPPDALLRCCAPIACRQQNQVAHGIQPAW
jgi:hypothetical protein